MLHRTVAVLLACVPVAVVPRVAASEATLPSTLEGTASGTTASSGTALSTIVQSGELRVALSGRQAPFNATNKRGTLMGLDVDLARRIADAMGVEVTFVTKPFPALLDTLATGEADIVISGLAITAERNMKAAFAGPYLLSGKSILTRSSELAAAQSAEELNRKGNRFVALAESTSETYARKHLTKATLTTVKDYDAAILKVLDGHADALLADQPACALAVLRFPDEGLIASEALLTVEPIGIAISPEDPLLLNLIENFLEALEMSGALERLQAKWLEDGSWVGTLP